MSNLANIALEGPDPRLTAEGKKSNENTTLEAPLTNGEAKEPPTVLIRPQVRPLHDISITFEEHSYYANKTRAEEELHLGDIQANPAWEQAMSHRLRSINATTDLSDPEKRANISDQEWTNASRALGTATKRAIFYLITTDILGPFALPFAFATMGWGEHGTTTRDQQLTIPGLHVSLFSVPLQATPVIYYGKCAWGMNSYEYPLKSYGDMGFRLYGLWLGYLFNILQSIQLLLDVGIIVVSNGEALSQSAKFKLCFAICALVWCLAGFFFGQVRTLQNFGWLANVAVWINVVCMIITMGAAAHSPPNFRGSTQSARATLNGGFSVTPVNGVYPPIQHSAGLPPSGNFAGSVNGAMQAVFAYGGAMISPEFMPKMRYPRDFLKGMWAAQTFIYVVYMFYGLFMYGYQGNVFAMVSALIVAALYGKIGIKAGIPDFVGLSGIVSAICILQFTYTFPPMLALAYSMKKNAVLPEEGFDPATGRFERKDSGPKRWVRGFFGGRWYRTVFNFLHMLGALYLAALGSYSAIENLITTFANETTNSFVCKSPL
ncbi:related to amino acid transporter [Phialocephala subalpina]|uniref:Related to amino acid transporter n=1 Tax=Phialocephala subalpina TaxID=576137 RepID=A0A1L7XEX4_9HELO|nr:related to amino acid transporter [Phialocephala subalpina]